MFEDEGFFPEGDERRRNMMGGDGDDPIRKKEEGMDRQKSHDEDEEGHFARSTSIFALRQEKGWKLGDSQV